MFIINKTTNIKTTNISENNTLIYKYTCDKAPWNETLTCYIVRTTTTVKERIKQHTSMKQHFSETHKENITESMILPNISILTRASDKIDF